MTGSRAAWRGRAGSRNRGGWKRAILRSMMLATLSAGQTGCAVGPDFKVPVAPDVPLTPRALKSSGTVDRESQRFVKEQDIPGQWWTLFRSRGLTNLMDTALQRNFDVKAAQAALRAADANLQAQRGAFFPTIAGNYTPTRQKVATGDLGSPTNSGSPYYTLHTAQLTVSYVPDVFGGIRRQAETLEAQAEAARYQLEATYLTLTSNIALSAIQEASIRGQIDATRKIIKIQKELLGILKQQLDAGQVSEIDVAAQEAALAQAEQTLPPLQKQLVIQRDLQAALAGQFAGLYTPETFDFASLHLPRDLPATVSSRVLEQRPDIRAAEANLHAAAAQVGVAIANRLPQFNVSGNVGRMASEFSNLFNPAPQFLFWQIAASVTQPIFDGFTLEQRQRAAEAGWEQAAAQYASAVVTALQNVADALQMVELDALALKAALAAERAAEKSLRLTREQLDLGQVSAQQLLNAQQVYFTALLNVVQARTNRYADTVALFQALGGGWWNRSDVEALKAEESRKPTREDAIRVSEQGKYVPKGADVK